MSERRNLEIDGRVYPIPLVGQRCPRCHRPAPRLDGIPCRLCAPTCGTLTDPKTGITHAYKNGCNPTVDLAGLKLKHFDVGPKTVTCLECIATTVEDLLPRFAPLISDEEARLFGLFQLVQSPP